MSALVAAVRDQGRLVYLSARLIAWRWFWIAAVLPLIWPLVQLGALAIGLREEAFRAYEIQNQVIGLPLGILALGLGVRIIAGDIDRRTLEIAYTVPGGTHRVWIAKLTAAVTILVSAEILLALAARVLFGRFPIASLYTPLQAAVFYLVLAMALSVLFKNEVTAALVAVPILFFGLLLWWAPVSPFYNIHSPEVTGQMDASKILARAVQNRVGYLLVIAALVALSFARAERREKMMS